MVPFHQLILLVVLSSGIHAQLIPRMRLGMPGGVLGPAALGMGRGMPGMDPRVGRMSMGMDPRFPGSSTPGVQGRPSGPDLGFGSAQPGLNQGLDGRRPGISSGIPGQMAMDPRMGPGRMGMDPRMASGRMAMGPGMAPGQMGMGPGMAPGQMGMGPGMAPGQMGMGPGIASGQMGMGPRMASGRMGMGPGVGSGRMDMDPRLASGRMGMNSGIAMGQTDPRRQLQMDVDPRMVSVDPRGIGMRGQIDSLGFQPTSNNRGIQQQTFNLNDQQQRQQFMNSASGNSQPGSISGASSFTNQNQIGVQQPFNSLTGQQDPRLAGPQTAAGLHPALQRGLHPALQRGLHPALQRGLHPALQQRIHPALLQGAHPALQQALSSVIHPALQGAGPLGLGSGPARQGLTRQGSASGTVSTSNQGTHIAPGQHTNTANIHNVQGSNVNTLQQQEQLLNAIPANTLPGHSGISHGGTMGHVDPLEAQLRNVHPAHPALHPGNRHPMAVPPHLRGRHPQIPIV